MNLMVAFALQFLVDRIVGHGSELIEIVLNYYFSSFWTGSSGPAFEAHCNSVNILICAYLEFDENSLIQRHRSICNR